MNACITRETFVFTFFRRVFHSTSKLELCRHGDPIISTCRLEVNKCAFTFSSEIRQINARALNSDASNARGPQGRVHWTSIKFRRVHWICLISRAKVNANLLT